MSLERMLVVDDGWVVASQVEAVTFTKHGAYVDGRDSYVVTVLMISGRTYTKFTDDPEAYAQQIGLTP